MVTGGKATDQPPIHPMKSQFHNNKNLIPIGENPTEKSIAQKRSKSDWGKRPRNGDEPHPNLNEKSISHKQVRKRQSCGCPDLDKFPT